MNKVHESFIEWIKKEWKENNSRTWNRKKRLWNYFFYDPHTKTKQEI